MLLSFHTESRISAPMSQSQALCQQKKKSILLIQYQIFPYKINQLPLAAVWSYQHDGHLE